jgi:molybdate transport system substrate-binding protein
VTHLLALALLAITAAAAPAPSAPTPSAPPPARTLRVAAAANLKVAIEALASAFEADHPGVGVAVTLGASGTFFAQLQAGAPFDLFLSADREYPRKLVEAKLAEGPDVLYAIGELVAWTPAGSPLDLEKGGLAALAGPGVKHLAIANPAVAPFGRAAEAALRAAGVLDSLRDRLVLGQSVAQAAQFASTGAADAALLPRSLTLAPELAGGRVSSIPAGSYPRQEQSAVVVAAAAEPELARAFLAFVTGPKGRAILARWGYALP